MRKDYPVERLCKAFGVSKSGYYAYLKRPVRPLSTRDLKDKEAIQTLYNKSCGTFGAKRIAGTLKANNNHIINHKRVARLMREMNMKSKIRRKKHTKEKKLKAGGYLYSNLLERDFNALYPNHKWVMDVTEFIRDGEKVFVSALMDLYDRNPIGVVAGRHSTNEMMKKTIYKAMKERNLTDLSQVTIHTDQGNVYRSYSYNQLSRQLGFTPSMSRKANCWDNAVIESFFSHLKTELPHHYPTGTLEHIELAIPKYIRYYKEIRSQKRLGFLSPKTFLTTYIESA